jgi:hypothetical protein
MNFAPEVLKFIGVTGIPLIIVAFFPFRMLRNLRVFFWVSIPIFILQFLLVAIVIGLSGMYAGSGVTRWSPWDGPSALGTLLIFGGLVFFFGWIIRR